MSSYLRFQLNRKNRRLKRYAHTWRVWLANYTQRHIYGGWQKLGQARGVFIAWALVVLVSLVGMGYQLAHVNNHYLVLAAKDGGTYSEGLSGKVTTVNPLYVDNTASADVNAVVFSGLTRVNANRQIEGDLATNWEISSDKKIYTFHLRTNAYWQDGTPLTAEDIAFTIGLIQNPDTRSSFASNWNGVGYEVVDKSTIKFTLPNSYAPFLYNTTVGILPKHILSGVKPSLLKTYEFNQKPIGSGPYQLEQIDKVTGDIVLRSFQEYYLGKPYIDQLKFVQYPSSNDYLEGYQKKQINGFTITRPSEEKQASQIEDLTIHNLSLPAYSALFFNTKADAVRDIKLRQALAYATNKQALITGQLDGQAIAVNYPILAGYAGFDNSATKYSYNKEEAQKLLAQLNQEELKNTRLRLATLKDSQYEEVAKAVASAWSEIGVQVDIVSVPLSELQQYYIRPRNYDVLLYGQDIGYDSDIYAYWHSSQAKDPGLNLSQYTNPEADKYLETGRVARDTDYKNARYSAFLQAWAKEVPAIILYSPYYDYAQNSEIKGFSANKLVEPSNRFYNIQKWYIQTRWATKASVEKGSL